MKEDCVKVYLNNNALFYKKQKNVYGKKGICEKQKNNILRKTMLLKSKDVGVYNSLIKKLSLQNGEYHRCYRHMNTKSFQLRNLKPHIYYI